MLAYGEWVKMVNHVKEFLYRLRGDIAVLFILGSWVWVYCRSIVAWVRGESGCLLSSRASGSIVPPLRGLSCGNEGDL